MGERSDREERVISAVVFCFILALTFGGAVAFHRWMPLPDVLLLLFAYACGGVAFWATQIFLIEGGPGDIDA